MSDTLSLWEMSALGGDPYGVCQGFQSCRMGKSEDLRVPGMTPNILEVSWVSQGIRRDCLRLQVPQGDRLDLVTPGPDTRFQSPSELRVFSSTRSTSHNGCHIIESPQNVSFLPFFPLFPSRMIKIMGDEDIHT